MGGKIDIYNLGETGVDVVKSPLHEADGDLYKAQNAHADPAGLEGGIRKRDGMAKVNSGSLGASVQGIVNVPLPDPNTNRTFYWNDSTGGADADTKCWRRSTDGIAWGAAEDIFTPPAAAELDTVLGHIGANGNYRDLYCASKDGKLYYPAYHFPVYPTASYQVPRIRVFDGTIDAELCKVPYNYKVGVTSDALGIARVDNLNNTLYVVTLDEYATTKPNCRARVFQLDGASGALIQIGNAFGPDAGENTGGIPQSLAWHGNRLWAGTINGSGADNPQTGKVYWIRPLVDDTWTLDHTTTVNQGDCTSLMEFRGDLYVGTSGFTGVAALILKRTPDGTWSTSRTGSKLSSGGASTYFAGLRVFNDALYAIYMGSDGAGFKLEAHKFDGTTWTVDQDLQGADVITRWPGMTVVRGDALYVALVAPTWKLWRKSGAVWTNVLAVAGTGSAASFLGYVE